MLRDDGVGVIEYTEQLTYLLFLKMAYERAHRPLLPERIVPNEIDWTKPSPEVVAKEIVEDWRSLESPVFPQATAGGSTLGVSNRTRNDWTRSSSSLVGQASLVR